MKKPKPTKSTTALAWDIPVPLLGTPIVVRQTLGVFVITFIFMALLFGFMLGFTGDLTSVPQVIGVLALVHLGLMLLALLVMLLYFGNHMGMHFRLDAKGVTSVVTSRQAKAGATAATVLSLATGNLAAAGSGLLASRRLTNQVPWADVQRVKFDDKRCTIHLLDSWHTLAAIFCPPEQYPRAKAFVLGHAKRLSKS